jgi:hypothetical protein
MILGNPSGEERPDGAGGSLQSEAKKNMLQAQNDSWTTRLKSWFHPG